MEYVKRAAKSGLKGLRAAGQGITQIPDIGVDALNAVGIPARSFEKGFTDVYDYLTGGRGIPETKGEELLLSPIKYGVTGLVSPAIKGTGTALKMLREYLKPTVKGAIGTAAATKVLQDNPDNHLVAFGASLSPYALTPLRKSVSPSFYRKGLLKSSPTRQQKVYQEIANDLGAKKINKAEHKQAGELIYKSTKKEYDVLEKEFEDRFSKLKSKVKDPHALIDVSKPAQWIIDEYKTISNPIQKKDFLQSPIGHKISTLLELDNPTVESFDKAIHGSKFDRLKMTYNDAVTLRRDVGNELSKAAPIGNVDEGALRKLSGELSQSIGSHLKKQGLHGYWKKLNKDYSFYSEHQKKHMNKIFSEEHNPEKIFRLSTTEDMKPYLKGKDFMHKQLSDIEKDTLGKAHLREIGFEEGELNPLKLRKGLKGLQSTDRSHISSLLTPESRQNLNKNLSTVKKLEKLKQEPGISQFIPEKITKAIGMYSPDESIKKSMELLEKTPINAKKQKTIAQTIAPKVRPYLSAHTDETLPYEESLSIEELDKRIAQLDQEIANDNKKNYEESLSVEELDKRIAQLDKEIAQDNAQAIQ